MPSLDTIVVAHPIETHRIHGETFRSRAERVNRPSEFEAIELEGSNMPVYAT